MPNFCASKKLLKKLGIGVGCKWIELSLWFVPWAQLSWNRPQTKSFKLTSNKMRWGSEIWPFKIQNLSKSQTFLRSVFYYWSQPFDMSRLEIPTVLMTLIFQLKDINLIYNLSHQKDNYWCLFLPIYQVVNYLLFLDLNIHPPFSLNMFCLVGLCIIFSKAFKVTFKT